MLCPRCGTPNRAQATTCVRCSTALPAERPAPLAPSRKLDPETRPAGPRVPLPSIAGLPEPRGMSGPAGGTKSSPWSPEGEGGTLGASILDDLVEEEITVLEGLQSLEPIAEVGFSGATQSERPGRRAPERAVTEEAAPSGRPSQAWEDIISATESPAAQRWGTGEGSATEPHESKSARPLPAPPVSRRPLIPERKDGGPPPPPVGPRGMPRFGPEAKGPAKAPAQFPTQPPRTATASPVGAARLPDPLRSGPPRAADPRALPSMPPSKTSTSALPVPTIPRSFGTPRTEGAAPPVDPRIGAPTLPNPVLSGRPAPGVGAPAVRPPLSPPAARTGASPPPVAVPAAPPRPAPPTATRTGNGPPPGPPGRAAPTGARSSPVRAPIPDAPTQSVPVAPRAPDPLAPRPHRPAPVAYAAATDDLLISSETAAPEPDEPPGEETRLGVLNNPLNSQPVRGAAHLVHATGGQTIAAPGELAGLLTPSLSNPPVRHVPVPPPVELSGVAADLSMPVAPPSASQVERGLLAPLPTREEAPSPTPPPRPLSLERFESSLSSIPLPDPPPLLRGVTLSPQAATQPLPEAPAPPVGEAASSALQLSVSPAWRRLLAMGIDAGLVLGITTVLALLGFFGEAVSQLSPDPDNFTGALGSGALTLPIAFLLILMLTYSIATHATLGRSLGKLICGLELVVTRTGQRPRPLRASWRGLSSVLGFVMLGAGYFWVILDRRNRTLHDRLSGTTVVVAGSRREPTPPVPVFGPEPTA